MNVLNNIRFDLISVVLKSRINRLFEKNKINFCLIINKYL